MLRVQSLRSWAWCLSKVQVLGPWIWAVGFDVGAGCLQDWSRFHARIMGWGSSLPISTLFGNYAILPMSS